MGVLEILSGLKNKVLDASTYDLLKRNFELLESNYQLTKDENELLKSKCDKLQNEVYKLAEEKAGLWAEIDMMKGKI